MSSQHTSGFRYALKESQIALRPRLPRDGARLLVASPPPPRAPIRLLHHRIRDLPSLLSPGDLLVVNNTRVIKARLSATPHGTTKAIECLLCQPLPIINPSHDQQCRWSVLLKGRKRIAVRQRLDFSTTATLTDSPTAAYVESHQHDGTSVLVFSCTNEQLLRYCQRAGALPLPPYIHKQRALDDKDEHDYQTLFATQEGAVAAPTAGLHFTPKLMSALYRKHVRVTSLTLHTGHATFLPLRAGQQHLPSESFALSASSCRMINRTRSLGGNIIAVGTTTLRTLETCCSSQGWVSPQQGQTTLFIKPGYRFRCANKLLTNFHLPGSSLIMLVRAFSGTPTIRTLYDKARVSGHRFYSYGDACLLSRQ